MAIQVRRGNESDFDASKMLPGEWAVSLDTKYVRMCFAPGVVLRMATYEGFEADKAQFQAILAECRSIQSAVQRIQAEVNSKASLVVEYSNSAKKSADSAYKDAERAKIYADNAEAVTGIQIATKESAGLIKGGDNHIAEDGTLMLITTTDSTTQPNSYAGRENILEIGGVTEQGENPSPTNKQEIKKSVVKGVKTHGKNFWTFGDIKIGASTNLEWNIPAGAYTFSCSNSAPALLIRVFYTDESNELISLDKSVTTFTLKKDVYKFNFSTSSAGDITNIQVEAGTVATDYEPYTESTATLSQPIELYGRNGVIDRFTPKEIKRKYVKMLLNANAIASVGYYEGTNSTRFVISTTDVLSSGIANDVMCNIAIATTGGSVANTCRIYHSTQLFLFLDADEFPDKESLSKYLETNEVYFVYGLAEEVTEELPLADQIALNSLQTYDGITYVEFDSEIQPTFKGEYGTSKVGGYTLESLLTARNNELKQNMVNERLSALETSVVNNI